MDDNVTLPSSHGFTAVNKNHQSPEPVDNFLLYHDQNDSPIGEGLAFRQSLEDVGLAAVLDDFIRTPSNSPDNSETLKATSEADSSNDTRQGLPYSYETVVDEAREYYADPPPFCIRDKGQQIKVVQDIRTKDEVELHFRKWSDANGYGYWEYENPSDDTKHIVKYDSGQYYPWQGVDAELLMDRPVATIIKPIRSSESARTSFSLARSDSADGHSERSVSPTSTRDRLRKRTTRQERPFEMDKVEHNLAKKGVIASEAELANTVKSGSSKSKRARVDNVGSSKNAKRHSSSKLLKRVADPEVVDIRQTTIRTRLDGFSMASLPLPLNESSVKELLDAATAAWRFKLNGNSITYGIVSFPWLDDRSNIILSHDNNDTAFEIMLDEIRKSPMWTEGRCSIDLELFA